MSRSTDPGHFFQTDAADSNRARRAVKSGNKYGSPILLHSKLLSVIPDPFDSNCIYIAESAGCVRKVNIKSREVKSVYRGPVAPVTSVAIGSARSAMVFAGCWDKDIWSWDRDTKILLKKFKGHSDFVKTITTAKLGGKDVLISGGADSKIMVWDTATGERLHTLRDTRDTMMALQNFAIDPQDSNDTEIVLVSSSSDPGIRRWRITLSSAGQTLEVVQNSPCQAPLKRNTILEHKTSVYQVLFSGDDEESNLWTCSADGTAKCLLRSKNWSTEETYQHGDYVRAVAVTEDWVITAGRDEDVKIWDRNSGNLRHVYDGHFEEVTGLVIADGGRVVVSVSIDGTVRTWELQRAAIEKAIEQKRDRVAGTEEATERPSLMTAEEEAELTQCMVSDGE